jgi:hypothetical protein
MENEELTPTQGVGTLTDIVWSEDIKIPSGNNTIFKPKSEVIAEMNIRVKMMRLKHTTVILPKPK